jgi:hypothetical protein
MDYRAIMNEEANRPAFVDEFPDNEHDRENDVKKKKKKKKSSRKRREGGDEIPIEESSPSSLLEDGRGGLPSRGSSHGELASMESSALPIPKRRSSTNPSTTQWPESAATSYQPPIANSSRESQPHDEVGQPQRRSSRSEALLHESPDLQPRPKPHKQGSSDSVKSSDSAKSGEARRQASVGMSGLNHYQRAHRGPFGGSSPSRERRSSIPPKENRGNRTSDSSNVSGKTSPLNDYSDSVLDIETGRVLTRNSNDPLSSSENMPTDSLNDKAFAPSQEEEEYVSIPDDVYNMFFISSIGGQAFFYSLYVFLLKMALFSFLAVEIVRKGFPETVINGVRAAQFLMLPVAVAIQGDLTASLFVIANLKYSEKLRENYPEARKWKYYVANTCRFIDGCYSLFVNFIILVQATEVLGLFLNFAALQFLQTIDNIALDLAAHGYLSERLEKIGSDVQDLTAPRNHNPVRQKLDSVFFGLISACLVGAWVYISFIK